MVLLAIEMKTTKVKMKKPVYLGSISVYLLEISKALMYKFWYDYTKPKYGGNVKLCYMDTDSFMMHIKTDYYYKVTTDDVKKDLVRQIMKSVDQCLQERIKK